MVALVHTDSKRRLRRLATIALPMVVSQASETVMLFVDRLFLSRVGKVELASAMSGGLTSFMVSSFFTGVVGYVNALVAQYYGARRQPMCVRSTAQALYLSVAAYPILLALIPLGRPFFAAVGQSPEQIGLADAYLRVLLFGSILQLARVTIGSFFIGTGRTRVVMIANIVGMIFNVPANYVFIFGKLGFPVLGITGAGIGTICGNFVTLLILVIVYLRVTGIGEFKEAGTWKIDRALTRRLLKYGIPAGTEALLNVSAFNLFVQLMHSYGQDVAAAVTIAFNYDIVAFIPMLGLGVATTAMVGNDIGAGDRDGAVATARLASRLAYLYSGSMMVLFIFGAPSLVRVFASGFDAAGGDTSRLAATLIRLASLYTMADATQLVYSGALRGAGDTKWVMRASIILHWTLAVCAVALIRFVHASPVFVWCVFIGMIIMLSVVMLRRFRSGAWRNIELI